jgi:trimeric autotransporter adhesin
MAATRRCVCAVVLLGLACSRGATGPNTHNIANIVLTPDTLTVAIGDSATIQAQPVTASGADVNGVSLFWSSSNTSVATVGQNGTVKAVGVGTATIDASVAGVSPRQPAQVVVVAAPVASIIIAPKSVTLRIGDAFQFTDTTKDASGNVLTGRTVTWTSSDTTIAPIDQAGLVLGKKQGSVTITAASGSVIATATVTVTPVPVAKVVITPSNPTVVIGGTTQLTATPEDSAGDVLTGRTVTWASSDPTTASVNQSGVATGKKVGSVTITATADTVSGSVTLTVQLLPVNAVTISPQSSNLVVGQTTPLTAEVTDNSGTAVSGSTVAFSSSAASVATVTSTGPLSATVTAVGPGQATITGASGGKTGTATITVSQVPVGSVTITPSSATITLGATTQLSATVKDTAGNVLSGRPVTWVSLNHAVATVSATGLVTAAGVGSAVIEASSGGQTGVATVTVTQVPVGSVTISPKSDTVSVNAQRQLAATVLDANGHTIANPSVAWSSSNSGVATVSSTGLVQGVAPGTAKITAQSGGKADTNTTLVIPAPVASVNVSTASNTVSVGQTTVVTATSKDANGNVLFARAVTWSSSKSLTASVSAGGVDPSSQLDTATVTGVATGGPVTITATSSNQVKGNVSLTVSSAINHIVLTPNQFTVNTHATQQVTAQAFDVNNNPIAGVTFSWQTKSGGSIASVNTTGLVTGVAPGSDSVYASSGGKSGGAAVTVDLAPVGSVTVVPASAQITNAAGQSVQLTDTVKDANGDTLLGRPVTWSSSNTGVANVSPMGLVTPAGPTDTGSVIITAASGGKSGTATVHVISAPATTAGAATIRPTPVTASPAQRQRP